MADYYECGRYGGTGACPLADSHLTKPLPPLLFNFTIISFFISLVMPPVRV